MLLVLDIDVTAVYCRCFCSLRGEKDRSFRYGVTVNKSGILDVLTDPPTSATVDTFEGFLFAMYRARCNACER